MYRYKSRRFLKTFGLHASWDDKSRDVDSNNVLILADYLGLKRADPGGEGSIVLQHW